MNTIDRRLHRLEDQFGYVNGKRQTLRVVLSQAGLVLALDQATCLQILRECGFLPTGPVGLVKLSNIPDDLNAEELERFLREHGAELCSPRTDPV